MRAAKRSADFILPKICPLCGEIISVFDEGELCAACLPRYSKRIAEKCAVCRREASVCDCSRLRVANLGANVAALGFYKSPTDEAGRMIYALKREYSRDLIRFFARSLAGQILRVAGEGSRNAIVTFPPRSAAARREYGFDHARKLAKATAKYLGASFCPALRRTRGGEQKALGAADRADNAIGAFEAVPGRTGEIAGRDVILIDDVATTGATLASAANSLKNAGAATVRFAVLLVAAERPQSERQGLWFEEDDAPGGERIGDLFADEDPLADDVGF